MSTFDEKCTCKSTFLKKNREFLVLIFAKFDQILASFRQKNDKLNAQMSTLCKILTNL